MKQEEYYARMFIYKCRKIVMSHYNYNHISNIVKVTTFDKWLSENSTEIEICEFNKAVNEIKNTYWPKAYDTYLYILSIYNGDVL